MLENYAAKFGRDTPPRLGRTPFFIRLPVRFLCDTEKMQADGGIEREAD